ncbi:MAG: aminopeptidase P family protein [Hyphomicrobiales bacterium]|nr:aminopeptidase P family protein [Hyphomicrobiales bacterium]
MNPLQRFREFLKQHGLEGMIVPSTDPFMGEYVPECWQRLRWLSGFDGSAGLAVVLRERAGFFTDGRYTLQAREQTFRGYEVHNSAERKPADWLKQYAAAASKIAYDPALFTERSLAPFQKAAEAAGLTLIPLEENPVDTLWQERPAPPTSPARPHYMRFAGEESASKRTRIAEKLRERKCEAALLTAPDSVCWLLNIRGNDVPHTPLLLARVLLVVDGTVVLFLEDERVDADVRAHLGDGVTILPPEVLSEALAELAGKQVLVDTATVSMQHLRWLEDAGVKTFRAEDPCQLDKACKNKVEQEGMHAAHVRDGVALVKFLHWLEGAIPTGEVTEMNAAERLRAFRAEAEHFQDTSFETISGFKAHGAIVHYRATPDSDVPIQPDGLYLLDSGGQYRDGTTDVTRTLAVGTPTAEQKHHYTLVLKGHIALASAVFPEETPGSALDALARNPLWAEGLDYDHGTGHGVGSYLSVHEGPQRISKHPNTVALQPGMVLSNEPGYYREGQYGIRIENLVIVRQSADKKRFLCFDTLTCVPLDRALIEVSMLTTAEREWVNRYHVHVRQALSSYLSPEIARWLGARTATI